MQPPLEVQYVGMLGALLVAVGAVMAMLPVGQCDRCQHCRNERLGRPQVTNCPCCRGMHLPGECQRDKADD